MKVRVYVRGGAISVRCSRGTKQGRRVWVDGESVITPIDNGALIEADTGELCGVWIEENEGDWKLVIGRKDEEAYWGRTGPLRLLSAPEGLQRCLALADSTGEVRRTLARVDPKRFGDLTLPQPLA